MSQWPRSWVRYLPQAFTADLRSLAVARIGIAAVILGDLMVRGLALEDHYADSGVVPRSFLDPSGPLRWSLHTLSGATWFQLALFLVAAVAAVCLGLGFRTRLATVVSWLLVVSLQNRNPLVLTGGDTLLRCLLFWACFVPWGARWSIDHRSGHPRSTDPGAGEAGGAADHRVAGPGIAAWMVQVALLHLFAGLLKTGDEWRSDFDALYYTLGLDELRLPLGDLLLGAPPGVLRLLTGGVLVAELALPFLLFPALLGLHRWQRGIRATAAGMLIAFHVGLIFTLRLGIFPWVSLVSLLVFLPGEPWQRIATRIGARDLAPGGRGLRRLHRWAGSPGAARGLPRWQKWVVLGLLALAVVWNLGTLDAGAPRLPEALRKPLQVLRLDQRWNLFAPRPRRTHGWLVIPGQLREGDWVDLFRDGAPVRSDKPESVAAEIPTYRWRKLLRRLTQTKYRRYRRAYGEWMCREWNRRHRPERQVLQLRVLYLRESTPPPGERAEPPVPVPLLSHRCE